MLVIPPELVVVVLERPPVEVLVEPPLVELELPPVDVELPPLDVELPPLEVLVEPPDVVELTTTLPPPPELPPKKPPKNPPPKPPKPPEPPITVTPPPEEPLTGAAGSGGRGIGISAICGWQHLGVSSTTRRMRLTLRGLGATRLAMCFTYLGFSPFTCFTCL